MILERIPQEHGVADQRSLGTIYPIHRFTGWHNESKPGDTVINQLSFYTSGFL